MMVGNLDEATGTTVNSEWTLTMSKFRWILSTGPVEMKMPCMNVVSSFQIPGCCLERERDDTIPVAEEASLLRQVFTYSPGKS